MAANKCKKCKERMAKTKPTKSRPNGGWRCLECSRAKERGRDRRAEKRDRYSENTEKILKQNAPHVARWARENADRKAASAAHGRAKALGLLCTCCTVSHRASHYSYVGACSLAGCTSNADHVDHHVPLKLGGLHCTKNFKPLCEHHNASKGAKLFEDWIKGD
jgi:hypothetical protein